MKTSIRLISIGAICLLIGLVVGFFVSGRITKKRIHQKMEMQRPPAFKQKLLDKLELTDVQEVAFEKAFDNHMDRMRSLDDAMKKEREAEFKSFFSELREGMTESQKKEINQLEQRLLKRGARPRGRHRPTDGHPPPMPE